jgi:acetyltransferase-like isoleucine patch superfamily enzyme
LSSIEEEGWNSMIKRVLTYLLRIIAFIIVSLPALTSKLEEIVSQSERVFQFWGQFFALFPGFLGSFIRCAYYKLTILKCSLDANLDFAVCIAHRETSIGDRVIITSYTSIGRCMIGEGSGIGSGCHIISGKREHTVNSDGIDFSIPMKGSSIKIGRKVWIGDGCIVMADIGDGAVIGAGSVVNRPVENYVVAAGNPARVIKTVK